MGPIQWYQEPEVFWLDGEGNFFSAEPTDTVRGPDGLYTVSSRVIVEKRRSNNFTCRVRQNNINQTRETHFIVPGKSDLFRLRFWIYYQCIIITCFSVAWFADDIFNIQPSTSPVIIGVSAGLVVGIVLIVAVVFFVWKWKQNSKSQMNCSASHRVFYFNILFYWVLTV